MNFYFFYRVVPTFGCIAPSGRTKIRKWFSILVNVKIGRITLITSQTVTMTNPYKVVVFSHHYNFHISYSQCDPSKDYTYPRLDFDSWSLPAFLYSETESSLDDFLPPANYCSERQNPNHQSNPRPFSPYTVFVSQQDENELGHIPDVDPTPTIIYLVVEPLWSNF